MKQPPLPSSIQRVLEFSLILIFLSAFGVFVLGNSSKAINNEIKQLNNFLVEAEHLQPNFESSLIAYTEETNRLIDFVLSLRPDSELEYITFIAEIEDIGQDLSLNIDLESIDSDENSTETTLDYNISFYGSRTNLVDFLAELESLPYFIKVDKVDFSNGIHEDNTDQERVLPNINLKVKLYVK